MLQKFFLHRETADEDEWGRGSINKLPVASVHQIGILDIRIANEDRHGGNLLLDFNSSDGAPRLVPIDHEFTLPPWSALGNATFCWSTWPQVRTSLSAKGLRREATAAPVALLAGVLHAARRVIRLHAAGAGERAV